MKVSFLFQSSCELCFRCPDFQCKGVCLRAVLHLSILIESTLNGTGKLTNMLGIFKRLVGSNKVQDRVDFAGEVVFRDKLLGGRPNGN